MSGEESGSFAPSRFRIGEFLGGGAFGEVYRAYDEVHCREVALKLLYKRDPVSLANFKKEFRSVASTRHPHLVSLYSLHREGERWFYTMDLVDGDDLLPYLHPKGRFDSIRAQRAFREIAEGLAALHQSGHIHRDVKPSNVRIGIDGRVRLLDFGFAQEVDAWASKNIVGTPVYIAPEVLDGQRATPASDWYAFGVLLFRCLTGEAPFEGSPMQIMVSKQKNEAPSLPEPDVLSLRPLLAGLLERKPDARFGLDDVLQALGETKPPVHSFPSSAFVGREDELQVLEEAFERALHGEPSVVWVEGEAGSGKTALLDRFVRDRDDACVLRGRCFPREALPYKGVDAAIDDLTDELRQWSQEARDAVLPTQMGPLLTLFPVLGRVAQGSSRQPKGYERSQFRVEAFTALCTLLSAVAERRPVILALDDLQWSDEEGTTLLQELLRRPTARMLFVGAHRPLGASGQSALRGNYGGKELSLAPLDSTAATQMARILLDDRGTAESAAKVAEEAGGNPLFVELLARHGPGATMAEALDRTLLVLEPETRALLEQLCVSGRPVLLEVAREAADMTPQAMTHALDELRTRRLASVDDGRDPPSATAYHDRIAELVVAGMGSKSLIRSHTKLALALASRGRDPEAVAYHFDRAGHPAEAADWSERAARRAEQALAWERAALLYARVIALRRRRSEPVAALHIQRGDALAYCGRSAEAVSAFRHAISAAHHGDVAVLEEELLRRIAEQLLRSGQMKEGVATLSRCLNLQGLRFPKHPAEALATLLALRARLRLRGLEFTPVSASEVSPNILQRVDTCWSAGVGLSFVDSLRGAGFLTRSLLDALDAGEPYRVVRSLAYEACFLANQGSAGESRARATLHRAATLADGLGDPHLRALIPGARCLVEFHNGRWRQALRGSEEATSAFMADAVGMAKEVVTVQLLGGASMVFLGELGQLTKHMEKVTRLAELRRDLFALTSFRSGFTNCLWLAQDNPARARAEATRAFQGWEPDEYVIQHFFDLWAQTQIDLYEGDGMTAAARVRAGARQLRHSLLTRLQFLRIAAHDLNGRTLLADGLDRSSRRLLARHIRALRRERVAWALPLADVLEAGALRSEGKSRSAERKLAEAAIRFDGVDMTAHAASARLAQGLLEGGARGEARQSRASETLRARGIQNPRRWLQTVLPAPALFAGQNSDVIRNDDVSS